VQITSSYQTTTFTALIFYKEKLMDKILQLLLTFDKWLFIYINTWWTNSFFDSILPLCREASIWLPVYLFLMVFALLNFGAKAWPWILLILVTFTLTDQISSSVIKPMVGRLRPCRDPDFSQYVRLLINHCTGAGSFTSSHATNHFGAAVFISVTLKEYFKNWRYLFFIWAALVSYSQVYVGIHYPSDVIGGAILGSLIGYATGSFFNRNIGLSNPPAPAPF
jgi:undecaprenyl-diphosphatase